MRMPVFFMRHIKTLAVWFVMFNFLMVAVGSEFERRSIAVIKKSTPMMAMVDNPTLSTQFEVIRNAYHFFMVCGGAVMGGAIVLIFVILMAGTSASEQEQLNTHAKRAMYFVLAVFFSIAFTPILIRSGWVVNSINPEVCFSGAAAMAIGAWSFMKIVHYCLERLTGAAKAKGVKGVQEELTGTGVASPGIAPTPLIQPSPSAPSK